MWSLGPHCHSVLRGYRFRDPQWETDFQLQGQAWAVVAVRLYAVVAVLLSATALIDYRRYLSLQAGLVLHCAICGLLTLLFAATFCSRPLRRHIVPVFAAVCCGLAVCYCYVLAENVRLWSNWALLNNVPALMRLAEADVTQTQVEGLIRMQECTEAVYIMLMWSFNHWIFLAILGFSRYTSCCFLVVYVSLTGVVMLDPRINTTNTATAVTAVTIITLASGAFFVISVVMERLRRTNFLNETLLTRELQASQMADSMLNHTLKNLLADVAANIEMYLAGSAPSSTLHETLTCLRRGMMACKERQVYLKLLSREYVPVLQEVSLKQYAQQLVAGRGVRVEAVDLSVHLDSTICSLILENALSNAFRHGDSEDPCIRLFIESVSAQPHTREGFQRIRFTVENAADPDRPPITPEDAERLFRGQAHLVSNVRVPTLSDRVGIVHCVLAAQVGGVALSLSQAGNVVRFTAELDAFVVPQPTVQSACDWTGSSVDQEFPSGLRFCCIDDSRTALRLLELHLKSWCAPSVVHVLGHHEEDVACFVSFALQHADVVIVDQHLQYSRTYLGTDLVRQLRERGFPGLVCIRSASDSPDDWQLFRQAGAHCCLGKGLLGSRMVEELKAAYIQVNRCTQTVVSPLSHSNIS